MNDAVQNYIDTHSKSQSAGFLLTLLLGPLGLFYSSWVAALILCAIAIASAATVIGRNNQMKVLLLFVTCIALSSPAYAAVYKCKDASGKTVYQQTPCDAGEQNKIRIQPGQAKPLPAAADDGINQCVVAIKGILKDPDSLKVEASTKSSMALTEYAGKKLLAYKVLLMINAKNSYGGYVGAKPYTCYLSENNKRFLKFESPD